MRLALFHMTNNWDDALIVQSYLEYYGLNPVIPNYLQLSMNPFKIMAFGGIRIYLPEDQLELAQEIRATQGEYETPDLEPMSKSLVGMKIRTVFAAPNFFIVALIAICPPLLTAIFWATLFPWLYMTLYWWLCAGIICIPLHARYIAVPRLKKDTA